MSSGLNGRHERIRHARLWRLLLERPRLSCVEAQILLIDIRRCERNSCEGGATNGQDASSSGASERGQ